MNGTHGISPTCLPPLPLGRGRMGPSASPRLVMAYGCGSGGALWLPLPPAIRHDERRAPYTPCRREEGGGQTGLIPCVPFIHEPLPCGILSIHAPTRGSERWHGYHLPWPPYCTNLTPPRSPTTARSPPYMCPHVVILTSQKKNRREGTSLRGRHSGCGRRSSQGERHDAGGGQCDRSAEGR